MGRFKATLGRRVKRGAALKGQEHQELRLNALVELRQNESNRHLELLAEQKVFSQHRHGRVRMRMRAVLSQRVVWSFSG